MRVDIIEGTEGIRQLRSEWDAIYDADPEAKYFLSWSWLSGFLAPLGQDAFVLAARLEGGAPGYAALLPLRLRTKERPDSGFHNEINLAGNYVSDYAGFICRAGSEEKALPALADKVRQLNWRRLRLENFSASEYRSELFLRGFSDQVFETAEVDLVNADGTDNTICPFVALPDGWDRYLETAVSANTRQKLRRLLRQADGSDAYLFTQANADTLERDIEILLSMWARKWGPVKGRRLPGLLNADRRMLRLAFSTGTLFLPVLWHEGRPIGALAVLTDGPKKTYNFYRGARDGDFKGPSPGLMLHAHAIRHAIRNGFTQYDFLRGNEQYKYSFGCEERRVRSLVLSTRDQQNLGGRLDRRSIPRVLQRAVQLQEAGRLAEAERGYRQVLTAAPHHAEALQLLGQAAAGRGDHMTAVEQFRHLVVLKPGLGSAWYGLGKSLQAQGAWTQAADAYCEVVERGTIHPRIYCKLGQVLLKLDQFDLAAGAFEMALKLKADDMEATAGHSAALQGPDDVSRGRTPPHPSRHAAMRKRVAKITVLPVTAGPVRQSKAIPQASIERSAPSFATRWRTPATATFPAPHSG